jgi:hypothetical protein
MPAAEYDLSFCNSINFSAAAGLTEFYFRHFGKASTLAVILMTLHIAIDTKHYEIDGLKIEWGKPLNEVRVLLDKFEKFKPFGGWPNIRCKCPSAFGL